MTTDPTTPLTEARDALLAKFTTDWDIDPWGEYESARARLADDLDNLIALAQADLAARVEALEGALDGLLDYPYIMDGYGCRGCQQPVHHSDTCPVGKAMAVWSAATMGTEPRLRDVAVQEALAATPEPAPVADGHALTNDCIGGWCTDCETEPPAGIEP